MSLPEKQQRPDQVVNISDWERSEEYEGVFGKGARVKSLLFCPTPSPYPFLTPGHRYIYKLSNPRYPWQFWVEVFCYRVGCIMGIAVPPAFAAIAPNTPEAPCGALIEWFYEPGVEYIDGGNLFKERITGYDLKKGSQHNFTTLREIAAEHAASDDYMVHWAKVLTLDAVIGNTDRHHDNWGLVEGRFAPAFDNGTSMGHELMENNLAQFHTEAKLMKYVSKGTHHMKWAATDAKRTNHIDFVVRLIQEYPHLKAVVLQCLDFAPDQVKEIAEALTAFALPEPLTHARADFMTTLLLYRRDVLQTRIA